MMQAVDPIGGAIAPAATGGAGNATDAFGLSFESLLRIVLTQLTYQDPLKPMDNFQFVSQLAQFSQIQQTQSMSDSLKTLVSAQSTSQAAGLLGKRVDIPAGSSVVSGKVTAIAFADGVPTLTLELANNQTISNIPLGSVTQIREAN